MIGIGRAPRSARSRRTAGTRTPWQRAEPLSYAQTRAVLDEAAAALVAGTA